MALWFLFRSHSSPLTQPALQPSPPPPPPPPSSPHRLTQTSPSPSLPYRTDQRWGGKETTDKAGDEKRSPPHCPKAKGHHFSSPHPTHGEKGRDSPPLTCPTHTPSRRQHMRWPSTTHSTAATASGTSSVTRKAGSRSWGGDEVGGWKSPLPSNTPGPHTSPGAVGVGSTRSWKGE